MTLAASSPRPPTWSRYARADACGQTSAITQVAFTTAMTQYKKVEGCFVATAAWGSALASQVQSLRRIRDRVRPGNATAATAVDLYYRAGPAAAAILRRSETAAGRGPNVTFSRHHGSGGVFVAIMRPLMLRGASLLIAGLMVTAATTQSLAADERAIIFDFTPTERAQIAIWIEEADGTFLGTVGLTQAVSLRGIGNRPGAAQMNSGYHWPYGRREGVLPVWAHRRAAAPGAMQFPRIIFQHRPEGYASRTCEDSTRDSYFCLSFTKESTLREGLDAISCASVFNSDKGRFGGGDDYSEPAAVGGPPTWQQTERRSTARRCTRRGEISPPAPTRRR